MTLNDGPPTVSSDTDEVLGELIDQITEQLERGEQIDVARYESEFPRYIDQIRQLLPTLKTMVSMGRASSDPSNRSELASEKPAREAETGHSEQRLGDYRIMEEIGRGGMGVVYRAEQISMGRIVALKVLPFAAVMDEKAITRFKNEARAAGTLHHDNIVPVHAVGNDRGVYYYAMSLIHGLTVADVIHELKQRVLADEDAIPDQLLVDRVVSDKSDAALTGATSGSGQYDPTIDSAVVPQRVAGGDEAETVRLVHDALSTRRSLFGTSFFQQVARLGMQTADALHHAHEHGIVHRDIKPGNLMVDPAGKVWVTDFGLARIESDAGMTMTGDLLGTLRYMAPEQALAKRVTVDHRADIYSLGVTLYELLTLRPVFDAANREELLKKLAFDEPKPIRQMHTGVPVDLETIVMKAIAKSPDERYATADELAEDLRAFQENRAILAKPLSLPQRTRKWALRHQGLVAGLAAVLLISALALGISTITIFNQQAQTQAALDEAQDNLEEANRQKQRAEENFQRAREAVDTYLTKVSEDILLNNPGLEPLRKDLLELALKYYQEFIADHAGDLEIQAELAAAYYRFGQIELRLGHREAAAQAYEKALSQRRSLLQSNPDNNEIRNALAETYLNSVHKSHTEWVDNVEKAIEVAKPLMDTEYRASLAKAYANLGEARIGSFERQGGTENIELSRVALMKAKGIVEEPPETPLENRKLRTAEVYDLLYLWNLKFGDVESSDDYSQRVIDIIEGLVQADPENIGLQQRLSILYRRKRETEKSIELSQRLADRSPLVIDLQTNLAKAYEHHGMRQREKGDWDNAIVALKKNVEIYVSLSRDYPNDEVISGNLGAAHRWLGDAQRSANQSVEATKSYTRAIEALAKTSPVGWSILEYGEGMLSDSYHSLSLLHEEAGRLDDAIIMQRKRLESMQNKTPPKQLHHRRIFASAHMELGRLLRDKNAHEEALASYHDAIEVLEENLSGDESSDGTPEQVRSARRALASYYLSLARYLEELERSDEAADLRTKAVQATGTIEPESAGTWRARGKLYFDLEKDAEALADLSKTIQLNPNLTTALKERSWTYKRLGKPELALADVSKAIEQKPSQRPLYLDRAIVYRDLEKFDLALEDCQHAIDADPENDAKWFSRATAFALRGDIYFDNLTQLDQAVIEYTRAIELDSDNPDYLEKRGVAYQAMGDADRAAADLESAARLGGKQASDVPSAN